MNWLSMCINAALEYNEIKEAMGLSSAGFRSKRAQGGQQMITDKGRDELKPCPFCGNQPRIISGRRCDDDWGRFWEKSHAVYCATCNISIGESSRQSEAIKAWNTRTDAEKLAIAVKALEDIKEMRCGDSWKVASDALKEIQ